VGVVDAGLVLGGVVGGTVDGTVVVAAVVVVDGALVVGVVVVVVVLVVVEDDELVVGVVVVVVELDVEEGLWAGAIGDDGVDDPARTLAAAAVTPPSARMAPTAMATSLRAEERIGTGPFSRPLSNRV